MYADGWILASEIFTDTHHCSARSDTGDKSCRFHAMVLHLEPDLRPGGAFMGFCIGDIGELLWKEYIGFTGSDLLRDPYTSQKTSLFFRYRDDLRTEATDDIHAFAAHPVGHDYANRMP